MRLIKNDVGQIFPDCQDDMPMFQHCSSNSISVTEQYYFEFVEPLLEAHSVPIHKDF